MDIISVATLSMFGSAAVGGLIGFVVGKLTRFEIGLMVGLSIFGGVALWFAAKCFGEYREFAAAGADAVWGEVVGVIDKPSNESGSITSPAPIVRFEAPDGSVHRIEGPTASSAKVGMHVTVLVDRAFPDRSRIGQIDELRGGAIAFMLFGTFPMSFAFMLFVGVVEELRTGGAATPFGRSAGIRRVGALPGRRRADVVRSRAAARNPAVGTLLLILGVGASLVWIALPGEALLNRFSQGFGGVALALVGYALWGAWSVRGTVAWTWVVTVLMLALNFGVWSFALHLLN